MLQSEEVSVSKFYLVQKYGKYVDIYYKSKTKAVPVTGCGGL
jgi:hypothetical protein